MRNKLGAFFCLALGVVLISTGLDPSGAGSVGVAPVNCGDIAAGVVNPGYCPTGTITLTETTDVTANPAATAPADWSVTISAVAPVQCNLPSGSPTQTVANNGGPISFDGLYIFQDTTTDTYCTYELTETTVPGFTATFDPAAPYSFTFRQPAVAKQRAVQQDSPIAVVLHNVAAAASTSPAPTPTTTAPSSSASSTTSTSVTPSASSSTPIVCAAAARYQAHQQRCVGPSSSAASSPESASTSPALANTGTSKPIGASLYLGVGLCGLGFVLLFAGRRRRGEHS